MSVMERVVWSRQRSIGEMRASMRSSMFSWSLAVEARICVETVPSTAVVRPVDMVANWPFSGR
eukprot:11296787-Heterocapsa_arctica.AAC.1